MTIINFIIKNSFIERQTINVPHENATIYNMNAGTIFTLHSAFWGDIVLQAMCFVGDIQAGR